MQKCHIIWQSHIECYIQAPTENSFHLNFSGDGRISENLQNICFVVVFKVFFVLFSQNNTTFWERLTRYNDGKVLWHWTGRPAIAPAIGRSSKSFVFHGFLQTSFRPATDRVQCHLAQNLWVSWHNINCTPRQWSC